MGFEIFYKYIISRKSIFWLFIYFARMGKLIKPLISSWEEESKEHDVSPDSSNAGSVNFEAGDVDAAFIMEAKELNQCLEMLFQSEDLYRLVQERVEQFGRLGVSEIIEKGNTSLALACENLADGIACTVLRSKK